MADRAERVAKPYRQAALESRYLTNFIFLISR